jgi:hypothetical protein
MARFTQGGGSGEGSALNYVQVAGQQVTVSSAPASIIDLDITTTGKPVQISVTGEGSNASAGSWVKINLFRGNTAIGNEIQIEASAISENVPYAINFIDDVAAGTYNYSARVTTKSSGNWQFGEVTGPVMNAVELTGFKGDTGEQGIAGADGANGADGDSAYDIAVANGFPGTEEEWLDSLGGGSSADIADFAFNYDEEGTDSTITIHNHDMVIQTTRDADEDADINLNSADDIWLNASDDIELNASNSIYLSGTNGVYLGSADEDVPNPDNQVATIGDIQAAGTGDITFIDSTISNNTGDDIVIQNTDSNEVVKARITLDQGNEQVLIEAINTNSNTFTTADWTTATWSSNVIQITGTENGVIPFFSNVSGNVTHIQVNGGDLVQYDGASYGATDLTMYTMQNAPVGSDPVTITSLTLISGVSSKINIDYDDNDFQINANGMAIDMSSTDDITITAGGDDLRLRSWDDTIFTAGYNNNTQYEWRMNNNGRFELPASGYIENLNGASSDGNNNDVLHLVPDFNLVDDGSDQYLIIEPTFGSPNHLHLRPGGTIDESDTDIILGGERNSVHISDTDKAVIVSTAYRTEKTYTNISNESGTSFIAFSSADIAVGYTVNVDGIDYQVSEVNPFDEGLVAVVAGSAVFQAEGMYTFVNNADYENYWTFRSDGVLSGPAMGSVRVSSIMNAGADDLGFYANDADIDIQANAGSISLNSQYINLNANDDATISSSGGDHDWVFNSNGVLYGPAEDSHIQVAGIKGETGNNILNIVADQNLVLNNGEGYGAYLYNSNDGLNQIATIRDINDTVSTGMVRYSPTFTATGLTFTGSGATYPTYNSYYVKSGKMVSFVIEVDCSTVTNFGTGQFKLQLPFTPAVGFNHFAGWSWADPNVDPDTGTGHTIINADTAGITDVLDLHYLKSAGGANAAIREGLFIQGTPVTLSTISKIYVNGTYIAQ